MRVLVRCRVRFSAAHSYENIREPACGSSVRPGRIHGHNYTVDVAYEGPVDAATGMVVNITEIDAALKRIVGPLDESYLEKDHPEVARGIPTTENLALWIWEQCLRAGVRADLRSVRVRESEYLCSEYDGKRDGVVRVTRTYEFAAAHRLHSEALSDDENRRVFGKCNNPNFHGHNYGLEVTLSGPVDPRTGMVCNLDEVDSVVSRAVLDKLDHRNLSVDVDEFRGVNPTAENIAAVIWSLLRPELGDILDRIGVHETERNYFEYSGEG